MVSASRGVGPTAIVAGLRRGRSPLRHDLHQPVVGEPPHCLGHSGTADAVALREGGDRGQRLPAGPFARADPAAQVPPFGGGRPPQGSSQAGGTIDAPAGRTLAARHVWRLRRCCSGVVRSSAGLASMSAPRRSTQRLWWPESNRLCPGAAGYAELGVLNALSGPLQIEHEILVRWEGSPGVDLKPILTSTSTVDSHGDTLSAQPQRSGGAGMRERL